jgi:hypothetical protein
MENFNHGGMRCLIRQAVCAMFLTNSGCMTQRMLHSGQTLKHTEKDGRIIVDKKGNPAAYPFLIATVPLDILTSPLQLLGSGLEPRFNP